MAFLLLLALTGCGMSDRIEQIAPKREKDKKESVTTYKVAIVQYDDHASSNQIISNIEGELDKKSDELGVVFDYAGYTFNSQADPSTLDQIAAEISSEKVDVIIPISTPVAQVMQSVTEESGTPVIFSSVSDPVGAGLVTSLESPGGNITGVSDALDTVTVMNLMLAARPDIRKVGLLYDTDQEASTLSIKTAKSILDEKGIAWEEETGHDPETIGKAADTLLANKVEAVFTPTDNTVMSAELELYQKFIQARVPHFAGADSFALNGAFCGYGVNYREAGKDTADMAVEVLVNKKDPANIPVKTLENGIATINIETAEALGIDYSSFSKICSEVVETTTRQEFDD